jgi:hypothetical protein
MLMKFRGTHFPSRSISASNDTAELPDRPISPHRRACGHRGRSRVSRRRGARARKSSNRPLTKARHPSAGIGIRLCRPHHSRLNFLCAGHRTVSASRRCLAAGAQTAGGWPMSKKQRLAEYGFWPAFVVAMREAFQKACKLPRWRTGPRRDGGCGEMVQQE